MSTIKIVVCIIIDVLIIIALWQYAFVGQTSKNTVYTDCVRWCQIYYNENPEDRFDCLRECKFYNHLDDT